MKIKSLIGLYEKIIPIYRDCIDTNRDLDYLNRNNLLSGLCWYVYNHYFDEYFEFRDLFDRFEGYYRNCINSDGFLKRSRYKSLSLDDIMNSRAGKPTKVLKNHLSFRLSFMENEVIELKLLLKCGYTDV